MSEPFIGEIRIFCGMFNPRDWAFCNGVTLPISQNTALFAIIGTYYGGDGRSTMGLPNLQGCTPIHVSGTSGQGPGLSRYTLGQKVGAISIQLHESTMPNHKHTATPAADTPPRSQVADPTNNFRGRIPAIYNENYATDLVETSPDTVGLQGGTEPHSNQQPFLAVNYIISLDGVFPQRN